MRITAGLKTFDAKMSWTPVEAKFRGGAVGFQFVTAEMADMRAVALPGADRETPTLEAPLPLVEALPARRDAVFTQSIPSKSKGCGKSCQVPPRDAARRPPSWLACGWSIPIDPRVLLGASCPVFGNRRANGRKTRQTADFAVNRPLGASEQNSAAASLGNSCA